MRRAPFIACLLAGALLACATEAAAQLLSPGPLSRVHRALEGDANCGKCHAGGQRVVGALCLGCHEPIAKSVREKRGLHGTRFAGQNCGDCHVDHQGHDTPQIRWPGGDWDRFDHAPTGFVLRGAHARADCVECHTRKTPSGTRSFLGLNTACKSCHADPHDGRLGVACADCHTESSFAVPDFDHARTRFPLRGKHAGASCESCHGKPHRFDGMRFGDCSACHKDPHGGQNWGPCKSCHSEESFHVRGLSQAGLALMRDGHPGVALVRGHAQVACAGCHQPGVLDRPPERGARCVDCHEPVHEALFGRDCGECHQGIRWLGLPDEVGYRAHGLTSFSLEGQHRQVACARCHDPARPPAQRYRAVAHERCLDCHADVHAGQFAGRADGECKQCHTPHGFAPARFGIAQHARTAFALDGKHLAAPCGACHGYDHPRTSFQISAQACADCHANPHGELFAAELRAGGCAHCHTTAGWDRPRVDHSAWPLTGAHAEAHCDRCHSAHGEVGALGDAARFRDAPRECEGCHDDPHAGQFRLSDPVRGCAHCHGTARFAIDAFPHADATGFARDGAHAELPCGRCHAPEPLRNGQSAVRYRLGYDSCADCHRDPHAQDAR